MWLFFCIIWSYYAKNMQRLACHIFTLYINAFFSAFTEELCSVFSRRSVVTTQEEHHVTRFGHSEGGVEIEEVSIICFGSNPFVGV
jgi:hypothetical protein